jgi:Zn-dependent protease with chaperone function
VAQRVDGLFSGRTSLRVPGERRTALSLLVTVPVTLAVLGFAFHGVTPTQVAVLFVGGMVFVSLTRGRLLGSSIRARREEFPNVVDAVEALSRRLGIAPPQVFIRDDYFVPANGVGLGEPYALVISSQYLQLLAPEELAFMIGRELGHIASGNTRLLSLINATGRSNPVIASLFGGWIRQTEYTADRAGLLCSSPDAAVKAIAISTFHASGRRVEAAMLADQRRDIESDLTLRLGELTGMMPYAVNRVRALETFAQGELYAYWMERFVRDPLPVRAALGPADGPVDRRELASSVRRYLALLIDVSILSVIFDAVNVTVGGPAAASHPIGHSLALHFAVVQFTNVEQFVRDNSWLWYFPYAAGLVAIAGRTIGMMVLDLRVVRLDHGRVGVAESIWRYVVGLAVTITVVPLALTCYRRVQLHDRFSGSRLIGGRAGLR